MSRATSDARLRVDRHRNADAGQPSRRRFEGVAVAMAGPAVICAAVLAVLYRFAFRGMLSNQYPDVLPFWLPTYCLLGKTLAAGHILAWNPHVMAGVPFAADPQSGWGAFAPMLLFGALSCGAAMRWYIVLQPILGGLGMYGFLRSEGLSRPSATAGGLAMAMPVAGSYLSLNLPFAAMLAWTPVMLGCASRALRAGPWRLRIGWLAATAVAWGQIASASMSDGLVIGTGALLVYAVVRISTDIRLRRRTIRQALGLAGLLILVLPLVNLAILIPRFAYLPRTSIGLGYHRLAELSARLTGDATSGLVYGTGTGTTWPLRMSLSPGMYLGGAVMALSFAGFWARGRRSLAMGFALFGVVCYVLMLQAVAVRLRPPLASSTIGSFYLHDPSRFRFGLTIAIAVLAGLGVEAWLRARTWRERALMLVPGVVVWGILPRVFTIGGPQWLLVGGVAAGAVALTVSARRPGLAFLIPAVLAVELTVNGLAGQAGHYEFRPTSLINQQRGGPINVLHSPDVPASDFLREGATAQALAAAPVEEGRFMSLDAALWDPRGYHVHQRPDEWDLLGMQQSMSFGLEEAQGYNPAQLVRFWEFVRAADPKNIRYNAAYFVSPKAVVFDLLQVGWVISPASLPPPVPGAVRTLVDGEWALYRLPDVPPRASVVPSWQMAPSEDAARAAVLAEGFDPSRVAVVETVPGIPSTGGTGGTATYVETGPQSARVVVDSSAPAIVLVRNAFDTGWHATVDGQPGRIVETDDFLQGIPVPAGHHTISLAYDDPTIGYGLLGSALVLLGMLGAALALRRGVGFRKDGRAPGESGGTR